MCAAGRNPVGVFGFRASCPRVGSGSQPWASGRNPFGGCYEIRFCKSSFHWGKPRFAFFSFRTGCSLRTHLQSERASMLPAVSSTLRLPLRNTAVRRSHHTLLFSGFVQQRQALALNFVTPSKGIATYSPRL